MIRNDKKYTAKQLINYHAYCALERDFRPTEPPRTRQLPIWNAATRSQGILRPGTGTDGQIHSAGCAAPIAAALRFCWRIYSRGDVHPSCLRSSSISYIGHACGVYAAKAPALQLVGPDIRREVGALCIDAFTRARVVSRRLA
jgi:hypothetical protein